MVAFLSVRKRSMTKVTMGIFVVAVVVVLLFVVVVVALDDDNDDAFFLVEGGLLVFHHPVESPRVEEGRGGIRLVGVVVVMVMRFVICGKVVSIMVWIHVFKCGFVTACFPNT